MYLQKNTHVAVGQSITIPGQQALIAQASIKEFEVIFVYQAQATNMRTRTSIQVAANKHIEPGDFGAFANHSCNPNAIVVAFYNSKNNQAEVHMLANRHIQAGEEITFDYATTEYEVTPELHMQACLCGSPNCRKHLTGFAHLSPVQQLELKQQGSVAPYL